ncbi:MAG: hypothetical protein IPQ04_07205 [Saprospiraceae bacterium]|nr:hypothetical protein [Saprospiraceae bacterium]
MTQGGIRSLLQLYLGWRKRWIRRVEAVYQSEFDPSGVTGFFNFGNQSAIIQNEFDAFDRMLSSTNAESGTTKYKLQWQWWVSYRSESS